MKRDAIDCLKVLAVMVGLLLLAASYSHSAEPFAFDPPQNAPEVFKPYQSICHINVRTPKGSHSGSGTLIATRGNSALVLSCRHVCLEAGQQVAVTWPLAGGQQSPGIVVDVIPGKGFDTDIALLVCQRPIGVKPVKVVKFDPARRPFVAAGWREGKLRVATAATADVRDGGLIWAPSPFVGGMSGGCLFNRHGELVGVVVASDRVAWGVSADGPYLHALISKYRRGQ